MDGSAHSECRLLLFLSDLEKFHDCRTSESFFCLFGGQQPNLLSLNCGKTLVLTEMLFPLHY